MDSLRILTHSEAASVADGVCEHVPQYEDCYRKVFFALVGSSGRLSFDLPRAWDTIRRKVNRISTILAELHSRGTPHYVGITHSPETRWRGMYVDASGAQAGHVRKDEDGVKCAYPGHKRSWDFMKVLYATDSAEANALLEMYLISKHGRSSHMTNKSDGGDAPASSFMSPYFIRLPRRCGAA